MQPDDLMAGLPGEELVRQGLADVQADRCTVGACLVQIARPRLTKAGLLPPGLSYPEVDAEIQLYRLLQQSNGDANSRDAYSRYNALLRELVSFEMALDHRMQKQKMKRSKV